MLKGLILAGGLVLLWGLVQLAVFRARRPRSAFQSMLACGLPTFPLYVVLYVATPGDLGILPAQLAATPFWLGLLNGAVLHVALFLTGVQFYFHVARSISVRLLMEFRRAPGQRLSREELERAYGVEDVVGPRLEAMVRNGYLRQEGDCYFVRPRGRLGAWVGATMRRLLVFKPL